MRSVALAGIVAITLYRATLTLFDRTELSTDEAQYWFWGQSFAFGAYSKPPLIGWIIGASTELLGQSVAAVRLPASLLHGATALVLYRFTCRIAPAPVALIAALSYLTTPAAALGSALMTTDTPMLLAAAVALTAQVRLAEAKARGRPAFGVAMLFGLALGTGILAKHAMLFWLAGSVAAALLSPRFRPRPLDAALAIAVMLALIAPHLLWLVQHDLVTVRHVQDITRGAALSAARPVIFLAEQLVVMGPVLFAAMLAALAGRVPSGWIGGLAALTLAPVLIVLGQALQGPVLANWAVLFLIPGSVLGALWLARHPVLARLSILLGLLVTLALPLVKVFGTGLPGANGQPLLARYLGHGETARWALDASTKAGAATIVAQGRDVMADLSWFGAGSHLVIRAVPPIGLPTNHWEMTAPFSADSDPRPVLLLWPEGQPLNCGPVTQISRFKAPPGAYGGRHFQVLRLDAPECLAPQGAG